MAVPVPQLDDSALPLAHAELLHVEDRLWVLAAPAGIGNYDFRFDAFLRCRRSRERPTG